jgi:hypothetical protein
MVFSLLARGYLVEIAESAPDSRRVQHDAGGAP